MAVPLVKKLMFRLAKLFFTSKFLEVVKAAPSQPTNSGAIVDAFVRFVICASSAELISKQINTVNKNSFLFMWLLLEFNYFFSCGFFFFLIDNF